jgi:hypothetical protein
MTMKPDGAFTVELVQPIPREGGGSIDAITIQSPRLVHLVRWQEGQIVSRLGLLSELCGLSEAILQRLAFPDVDRVMFAFNYSLPESIRNSVIDGSHPLITPVDEATERPENQVNDPDDPRFPYVPGARKFPAPPVFVPPPKRSDAPPQDTSSIAQPPEIMKAV